MSWDDEGRYHISDKPCRTCGRYGCEGGAPCEMAAERRSELVSLMHFDINGQLIAAKTLQEAITTHMEGSQDFLIEMEPEDTRTIEIECISGREYHERLQEQRRHS